MKTTNDPFFIVGSPRSGTTLLRSVLDAHPNLCCAPWETGFFDAIQTYQKVNFGSPRGSEFNYCPLKRGEFIRWARESFDLLMHQLTHSIEKPRWGEKTPAHVFQIDFIKEVYPNARFIHIIRDGHDVVKSLMNVNWGPRDIKWSTHRWIDSVNAGIEAQDRLGSTVVHDVNYEALTSDPQNTLQDICEFLDEEFEPRILNFHRPDQNSWNREEKPISSKSLNQKRYRKLTLREKIYFKRHASPLLKRLGYL